MAISTADLAHLLRRTEFVVRPARLSELATLTRPQAVADIVNFAPNGNPQLPANLTNEDTFSGWEQYQAAVDWWFNRMTSAPRAFQEKMTLFWHGHFTSSWDDIDKGYQMMSQNQLYRTLALGSFGELTQRMALEPAMLVYLSNDNNHKSNPNQNFARELMELFTLGVGNYTEADVDASAHAWTGYNYDRDTRQYVYNDAQHDPGPTTFFGTTQAWTGPQIIDEILVNNVGKRLIAAKFIATKLWEFLAYPAPAAGIVDALATVFVQSGMNVGALATAILNRNEFYSTQAKQGLVRSPIELMAALSYCSGLSVRDLGAAWRLESAGQAMYRPPNVSGWRPNGAWLNTSAISSRAQMAENVGWMLAELPEQAPLEEADAATAIATVANRFGLTAQFDRPLSGPTQQALTAWHAGEPNSYWRKHSLLTMVGACPEMNMA